MSQLLKSSGAMSAATMVSRLLGLLREIIYAGFMGTTWVADAFNLAFMVPNLFRRLLGEGALTAAFIPIFKEKEKLNGDREMWRAANVVISGLTVAASALVAVGMAGISGLLLLNLHGTQVRGLMSGLSEALPYVLAGNVLALLAGFYAGKPASGGRRFLAGFMVVAAIASLVFAFSLLAGIGLVATASGGGKTLLMLNLLRVMFPYVLLVCLAAIFMGMLNARGHFFVPAMGATMLNVVMITSVLWLAPKMGIELHERIFGLAIGVVLAGVAQAAFQLPLLYREGFRLQWVSPWRDETVRRVVARMIPGAVGVAAFQINVAITQGMAFWVGAGVVTSFVVAVRLMELPQGVFGGSLATYILPTLSGLATERKFAEFRATLGQGLNWLVFVNLLAAALLCALAEPIIRLLFQHGLFDAHSTLRSALALRCLAPGLVAFSVVNILARAFYALGDVRTPMWISVFCLTINVVFAAALVWNFQQGGLGAANTLSALVNMALLFFALRKKLKTLDLSALRRHGLSLLGAAVLAGSVAWWLARAWAGRLGHETFAMRLGEVFVPMTAAVLIYLGVAAWWKTGHVDELWGVVKARWGRRG